MNKQYDSVVKRSGADIDVGLRDYMLKIYNYMTLGLGITGLISYVVASSPVIVNAIFSSGLQWLLLIAQFGLVVFLTARINRISTKKAQLLFLVYSAVTGLTFSSLFMLYTFESLARVFFITASLFGSMSIYGYTTKKDLTGMGSLLFMGLLGLIITSVVNVFLQSSALMFVTSVVGVLIFTGLTAYDTQKLKHMYYQVGNSDLAENYAVSGALTLYLDFINLFLYLLRFMGNRR